MFFVTYHGGKPDTPKFNNLTTAAFTGPQEIREGWLKLSPTTDTSSLSKGA